MPDPAYPVFRNRWRITGELTTVTSLHVGDGSASTDRIPAVENGPREVQTVCCTPAGRPYIPASSIKGPLRAWLRAWLQQQGLFQSDWQRLLGRDSAEGPEARGGALGFWDAQLSSRPLRHPEMPQPSFWNAERATDVAVSVSLDRRTRTASERHLFHFEYVPAGAVFALEITAQNVEEELMQKVLGLLAKFDGESIRLGAHGVHGWGRVQWDLAKQKVFRITADEVRHWMSLPDTERPAGFGAATKEVSLTSLPLQPKPKVALTFALRIHFHAPLLVRDPARTRKGKRKAGEEIVPHAYPLIGEDGAPILPARAVRGVLRSRAEAILRTLGHEIAEPSDLSEIKSEKDLSALNPATRLFGASGWRSALTVGDFHVAKDCSWQPYAQEFLAIDRFTGGGADGAKFKTQAVIACDHPIQPLTVEGKIELDLSRLCGAAAAPEAQGLLALIFRDLAEGDLSFGSGSAKGYGACTAEGSVVDGDRDFADLPSWFVSGNVKKSLAALIESSPVPAGHP